MHICMHDCTELILHAIFKKNYVLCLLNILLYFQILYNVLFTNVITILSILLFLQKKINCFN